MALFQRRAAHARRAGQGLEVHRPDLEPAVAEQAHRGADLGGPARRAHRRQRHHLVLVAGVQEPEVGGRTLVEQAQRMRHAHLAQRAVAAVAPDAVAAGRALAAAVQRHHRAVVERCGQKGAGLVAEMVRHVVEAPAHRVRAAAVQALAQMVRGAVAQLARRVDDVGQEQRVPGAVPGRQLRVAFGRRFERQHDAPAGGELGPAFGEQRRVQAVGDVVDRLQRDAGLLQAPGRGVERQLPGGEGQRPLGVLDAREALLLGGGDRHAVDDQHRGAVVEGGVESQRDHLVSSSRVFG